VLGAGAGGRKLGRLNGHIKSSVVAATMAHSPSLMQLNSRSATDHIPRCVKGGEKTKPQNPRLVDAAMDVTTSGGGTVGTGVNGRL
jgi:hypothetical protein